MSWTQASAPSAGTTRYALLLALTSVADSWTRASVDAADLWTKASAPSTGTSTPRLLLALTSTADPWTKAATPS